MRREKEYLKECLEKAGIKNEVITTWKRLQLKTDSHVGAVLREGQTITRDGSKRNYEDQNGVRCVRTKVYAVDTRFKVVIGEYSEEACEAIFLAFLEVLGQGIRLDGNYVDIELGEVEWVDKEDSILKANIACQIPVTFHGGIYRDDKRKRHRSEESGRPEKRERKRQWQRKRRGRAQRPQQNRLCLSMKP